MLRSIVNLSSLHFEPIKSDVEKQASTLFKLNEIVLLNILDKIENKYKITINGKLFQAELPLDLLKGESLIAKIVDIKPLTLSLDNISLSNKSVLYILLDKIGLEKNQHNIASLETLAATNKILSKSNIEAFAKFLLDFSPSLNDERLDLFAEIFFSKNDKFNFDAKTLSYHFKNDLNFLANKILSLKNSLMFSKAPEQIKQFFLEVFQIPQEKIFEEYFFDKASNFKHNAKNLLLLLADYSSSEDAKKLGSEDNKILNSLIDNLKSFLYQRIVLENIGIYTGFILYFDGKNDRLIEYQFQKSKKDDKKNVYMAELKFDTEAFGKVTTNLIVSGEFANIFFYGNNDSISELKKEILELENNLMEKLNLRAKTFFKSDDEKEKNQLKLNRSINVRI